MDNVILLLVILSLITIVLNAVVLSVIKNVRKNKLKQQLNKLEVEKNKIDTAPIAPELAKIEAFLKNEKLECMYNKWNEKVKEIKTNKIPKITDMLIEADYFLNQLDYKSFTYKVAKLELEIYKVKTFSEMLLSEIKEITTSEERNRAIITKLKAKYRDLHQKFSTSKTDYGVTAKTIILQLENIAKRFEDFEVVMENNEYTEVTQLIKAIDDMLNHMEVIIDEIPKIEILANQLLPKKIEEAQTIYKKMLREGYPLDYLNVEDNIKEATLKIKDILDRSSVLNIEDSVFELKVLLEYFETLFSDFEKEKEYKQTYDEKTKNFNNRLFKTENLVRDIFVQLDDIKNVYNLSSDDLKLLNKIRKELKDISEDYKVLKNHTSNNTFAFSKLILEIETLSVKLATIDDQLDNSLEAISSMREDEIRARQQLEEIKLILKEGKNKIREYNLPVIPESYFIQLNEASSSIKDIITELSKKPITISVLNTRVDTARDLVLKLFTTTKEMIKTAMFAEMAIVYGNRYRSSVEDLNKTLNYSEILFYKGDYKKSLEITINSLNRIENGIYDKLLKLYSNN